VAGTVNEASLKTGPPLEMPVYERLIDQGTAEADRRAGPVDHVTARRLAIWLAAQPQDRNFAQALAHFIRTGAITRDLGIELRRRARSDHPHRPQAARLVQYAISRRRSLGPLGPGFSAACDQADQADAMLAERRDRIWQGGRKLREPRPVAIPLIARASRDSRTVSLKLDPATASLVMAAIAAHAGEREAYARDVYQASRQLPEGSYGRQNREAIGAREMDAATRLRAIERAYHQAISPDPTITPDHATAIDHEAGPSHDPAPAIDPPGHLADREMELE
jgi:hypothetical protein